MPTWRWWIVVVLAAVFSMHGVLLVSPSAGSGVIGAVAAQHEMTGATLEGPGDTPGTGPPGPGVHVMPSADAPMPDPESGHGAGAHLWSLCLAILAGMALLGALVLLRRVVAADAGTVAPMVRRMRRWAALLRPPDLAALCLLRL